MSVLYFGMSEHIEVGAAYLVAAGDLHPEYITFHPDDFESVNQMARDNGRELVHIKYEPKLLQLERMSRHIIETGGK